MVLSLQQIQQNYDQLTRWYLNHHMYCSNKDVQFTMVEYNIHMYMYCMNPWLMMYVYHVN